MITPSHDVVKYSSMFSDPVELIRRDSGYEMEILPLQLASRHMKKSRQIKRNIHKPYFKDEDDMSDEEVSSNKNSSQNTSNGYKNDKQTNKNNNNSNNNNNKYSNNNNDSKHVKSNSKSRQLLNLKNNFSRTKITPSQNIKKSGLGNLIEQQKPIQFDSSSQYDNFSNYPSRDNMRNGYGRHTIKKQDTEFDSDDSDIELLGGNKNKSRKTLNTGDIPIIIKFEEHPKDNPITIYVSKDTTMSEMIDIAIQNCPKSLRGKGYGHYNVYPYEDEEIDKDEGTLSLSRKAADLGGSYGLCLNKEGQSLPKSTLKSEFSNDLLNFSRRLSQQNSSKEVQQRRDTIQTLKSIRSQFIRVVVPGPSNEQHTIKLDDVSSNTTLRDLYFMLNRKKQGVHFNPRFFDTYEDGQTKNDPLDVTTRLLDLSLKQVVVLPKIIGKQDPDRDTAFGFYLVKLANEYKEWHVNKVRGGNNKTGRLLGVDRKLITKRAISEIDDVNSNNNSHKKSNFFSNMKNKFTKQNHMPVNISDITKVRILSEEPLCCTLEYTHPRGGKRSHVYQFKSKQDCRAFVDKVSYLMELSKLRPS